jgi:hypothetical protein
MPAQAGIRWLFTQISIIINYVSTVDLKDAEIYSVVQGDKNNQ